MSRMQSLVILFLFPLSSAVGQTLERAWTDVSGRFRVDAVLVELSSDEAHLRSSDGRDIKVPIKRLSADDKLFVQIVQQSAANEREYSAITEHLQRVIVSPLAVAEIFDSLQRNENSGYAASFFAGIVNAITGDPKRLGLAKRQMDETIKRLRVTRSAFPNLHEQTLASTLNNRAIVALRDGSPDAAASMLIQASQVSESIPFAVYHNATLLMEAGLEAKAARISYLSDEMRRKTAEVVAKGKPELPGTQVPKRYMYCCNHDSFDSLINKNANATEKPNSPPPIPNGLIAGYERLGNGSGFLISDSLVVTNRHVIEGYERGLQFVLRNDTSFDHGEFASVVKVSEDKNADLALLRLKTARPDVSPIPVRASLPAAGETLIILGYPLSQALGEQVQSSRGIVNSVSKNKKEIVHDAATNPGNSGGPSLDEKGNIIGVVFAVLNRPLGSPRNFSVTNESLNEFLQGVAEYSQIAPRQMMLSTPEVIQLVSDAVVRVEVYGTASQERLKNAGSMTIGGNSNEVDLYRFGLIAELTCLQCRGTGRFRCPACRNGVVSEKRREQVATNPLNGQPIIGDQIYTVKCENCKGAGGFKCPQCDGGRLSFSAGSSK